MGIRHFSNCIVFALSLSWHRSRKLRRDRRRNPGLKRPRAYVIFRWSDFGLFPHVLYARMGKCGRLRVVSYKPVNPQHKVLPPPLFRGTARWGDN